MEKTGITAADVARIGLLFLDGEDLERVLIDKKGHTDYDFACFSRLKRTLLQIEKIAPELELCAILWQAYTTNPQVGAALVAGSSLPVEGCKRQYLNAELVRTMSGGEPAQRLRPDGSGSCYAPVRNSSGEIVGALELLWGIADKIDVSCNDMFVEQKEDAE